MMPGWWLVAAFNAGARGSTLGRLFAFAILIGVLWFGYARFSAVEHLRFPLVAWTAVLAFEVVVALARRDDARLKSDDEGRERNRRRWTAYAGYAFGTMMIVAAAICAQPWYAVLGVLFAYVAFMFARYVPDALFADAATESVR